MGEKRKNNRINGLEELVGGDFKSREVSLQR